MQYSILLAFGGMFYKMVGGIKMKKKRYLLNLVAVVALTFANLGASTYSWLILYEPKVPAQLRK